MASGLLFRHAVGTEQAANQIIEQATLQAEQATKNMLLNALKLGSSGKDISRIMGIPLAEVESVEKELLQLV